MNVARNQFFTRAALASDHYRYVACGNVLDQLENLTNDLAGSDKVAETTFGFDSQAQPLGLATQFELTFGIVEQSFQLGKIRQRFCEEISGALLHGLNSHVDAALSRDDQYRSVRVARLQIL